MALLKTPVKLGTPCGSLGFPLAVVDPTQQGVNFNLVERFQGANISAFVNGKDSNGKPVSFYETDSLMYGGSSGCPGFVESGEVFGMQNRSVLETPKLGQKANSTAQLTRVAISMWVTSMDIIAFAIANGVEL